MILPRRLNAVPQIFKIVAPFVFLSAAVATLNARLGMPPFALFLIALSLTDGAIISSEPNDHDRVTNQPNPPCYSVMTMTFFFNVTDTGKGAAAASCSGYCIDLTPIMQVRGYRSASRYRTFVSLRCFSCFRPE